MEEANFSTEAINEFQETMTTMGQDLEAQDMDYTALLDEIQDPTLKDVIQTSIDQITTMAAQSGFSGLFYSTVVLALIVVLMALVLRPIRNKNRI